MTDAEKIKAMAKALRKLRDRNLKRRKTGLYDSEIQAICRKVLKDVEDRPETDGLG